MNKQSRTVFAVLFLCEYEIRKAFFSRCVRVPKAFPRSGEGGSRSEPDEGDTQKSRVGGDVFGAPLQQRNALPSLCKGGWQPKRSKADGRVVDRAYPDLTTPQSASQPAPLTQGSHDRTDVAEGDVLDAPPQQRNALPSLCKGGWQPKRSKADGRVVDRAYPDLTTPQSASQPAPLTQGSHDRKDVAGGDDPWSHMVAARHIRSFCFLFAPHFVSLLPALRALNSVPSAPRRNNGTRIRKEHCLHP